MAVYQDKAKMRIKKGFRRINSIIEKGMSDNYKEADTRKIVSTILIDYLGWDEFSNLTAEQMIGSRYADFVIKNKDEELFVVEVKQISLKLRETHLNQARQYAVDEGIDWIILTNGREWQVYITELHGKIPVTTLVYAVDLASTELKPAEKLELLYLLSEEASRKKEIETYYQRHIALTGENLISQILSNDVLNRLRISINSTTGQKLETGEIAVALLKKAFNRDVILEEHEKAVEKIVRTSRQAATKKRTGNKPTLGAKTVTKA